MRTAAAAKLGMLAGLSLAAPWTSFAQAGATWSLVPQPAEAHLAGGQATRLANGSVIEIRGADREHVREIVDRFVNLVADTRGLRLRIAQAADAHAAITFELDPQAKDLADDGYRIDIGDRGISVSARTPQGVFYGSVTVWQLLTPPGWTRGSAAEIAAGTIVDRPRFAWRALLLDSGRHFQSVAEIEQLIDWMSLDKLNVLVWHLTEDQGWRIEVPAFPELVRIGACRKAVGLDIELTGSADKPYCGFYTAAQVREIVDYAAQRFVTVVPDLDLPGHSQAAIASYPWLGVTGERPSVWTDWGVSTWLLKPDAKTLGFVDAVLDDVMRLFPSPYVSIGGDEAAKDQWNASPDVRAQMRKLGLDDMDQLQGWFTAQVADHLVRHGRKPVGWDDELLAGAKLPRSEVVMSWHGSDGERVALEALRQGHDVVMTPQESLYFDHYQSDLPDEWSGQPPLATLRQAYDTAVVPPGATAAQAQHILGVQGCLWTELMPTFADDQHAVFPRVAALSELAWSPEKARDWRAFLERLPAEIARYRALGIGYADGAFAPAFALTAQADGKLRAVLSQQIDVGTLRYTTDGAAPTAVSPAYVQALEFPANAKVTLRAATFAPDGVALSAPRTQVVDADALRSRSGNALEPCSDHAETMRLSGKHSSRGPRPVYKVNVGDMCWRWRQAPLDGASRILLSVGRIAWQFADEASNVIVRPRSAADGEFAIHLDTCEGPVIATVPLTTAAVGQSELAADISKPPPAGSHDICVIATGDPRDGQWTLARIAFSRDEAR
ncbi:MAG TPA: family 20 glycosylhydrolase [Rudaea sp.]|nr:family 20 glycosylhydrolase [Rudaea sp.]